MLLVHIDNLVECHLLDNVPLKVYQGKVEQMALSAVNTDNVRETALANGIKNKRIDVGQALCLEIDGNGYMEKELINGIAFVLDDVILEGACRCPVERILVIYRLMCRMYYPVLLFDAGFAIEHFCLSVQFEDNIFQITLVKEHLPIKSVKIGCAFAVFGEVFVPNAEEIEFAFINKLVDISNGNISK